jgi:hypothetical protein
VDCVGSPFSREQWPCSTLLMTMRKVAICGPCEIRMVEGHTWTERGKRVACWLGFPMQGVHRFELPRLSDMSNHLPRGSLHIENLMAYNGTDMYNCLIATLAWLV